MYNFCSPKTSLFYFFYVTEWKKEKKNIFWTKLIFFSFEVYVDSEFRVKLSLQLVHDDF